MNQQSPDIESKQLRHWVRTVIHDNPRMRLTIALQVHRTDQTIMKWLRLNTPQLCYWANIQLIRSMIDPATTFDMITEDRTVKQEPIRKSQDKI